MDNKNAGEHPPEETIKELEDKWMEKLRKNQIKKVEMYRKIIRLSDEIVNTMSNTT